MEINRSVQHDMKKSKQAVPSATRSAWKSAKSGGTTKPPHKQGTASKVTPEQHRGLQRQLREAHAKLQQCQDCTICDTCRIPFSQEDEGKASTCQSCKYNAANSLKAKTGLTSLPSSSSNIPAWTLAAIEASLPMQQPTTPSPKVQFTSEDGPPECAPPEPKHHGRLVRSAAEAVHTIIRLQERKAPEAKSPLTFHYKPYLAELRTYYIDVPGWMSLSKKAVRADHRIVDAISAQLAGKPRMGKDGKTTMALARNVSFRLHKNVLGLSGEQLTESVSVAATIAFTRSIEHEIEVAEHMIWHNNTTVQRLGYAQYGFLEGLGDKFRRFLGRNITTVWPIALGTTTLTAHHLFAGTFGQPLLRKHAPGLARLRFLPLVLGLGLGAVAYGFQRLVQYWNRPNTEAEQQAVVDTVSDEYNYSQRTTQLPVGVYHGRLSLQKQEYEPIPQADRDVTGWRTGEADTHAPITHIQHLSLGFADALPVVPASSSNNETVAIHDRLYNHDSSKLTKEATDEYATFMTDMLTSEFPTMYGDILKLYANTHNLSGNPAEAVYAEWNSTLRVSPSVAAAHDVANAENQRSRVSTSDVSLFIKQEPAFFLSASGPTKVSAPRPIQNCSQQAHVTLGPRFYCFSKMVAEVWNADHWCCYASGIDKHAAAAFLVPGHQYVGDVSRFDRGLTEGVLKPLHTWRAKRQLFSTAAQKAAEQQLETTWVSMRGRHSGKYKGQRRSGDDNTSIDNTILNITAHAWAISKALGISYEQVKRTYKIIALGDDIVICGPDDLANVDFAAILATIGWVIKPAMVDNLDDVEFCSMAPWPSTAGRIFGAKPGRFFSRYGYCWDSQAKISMPEKAYGMLLNNNHVPFVRKLLQRQLQFSKDKTFENTTLPEWAMKNPTFMAEPTEETWTMFERLYGLGPADEATFEARLREWDGRPALMSDPMIRIILEKEELAC
jgi:hypothetical protein